nr:lyase family protein [Leptospira sp.]
VMRIAHKRLERDSLGEREIDDEMFYGIHTLRALENYPITGKTIGTYTELVKALAYVKLASAKANFELGGLTETKFKAIQFAAFEILEGKYHDQFVVDVIQGGAGTSTNMNANEVIANIGLLKLGYLRLEEPNYKTRFP